jgi:DNA-binding HxlR family transcriptional regulator
VELEKITDSRPAVARRRYDDACGTAHGLDLIGERWALLVMRELMLGPKRFRDIRADLPGISANVLTQRLEGLEESGLVVRRRLPPPASTQVYELTQWGYEAEPIVQHLGRWATRSPAHDPTLPLSATSIMLSFRTMFNPERARGRMTLGRGDPAGADVIFAGAPTALAAAVYGGQPLDMLAEQGALATEGDRRIAERFLTLFPLPDKVGATPT